MGVPFLFSHITRKNPDLITTALKNNSPDLLCLDFNCAIHFCNSELKKDKSSFGENSIYESELINRCEAYVNSLVDQFDKIGELFISIDGVPPKTKMIQQRRRRYLSSFMRTHMGADDEWDTNAISPGTDFMKKLNHRLVDYSHVKVGKVKFSGSEEPGEGETKIFNYLSDEHVQRQGGLSVYVYGLDADLIMLSLLVKGSHVQLMRESKFYHNNVLEPFIYLDIDMLSRDIRTYMREVLQESHALMENYLETYVVLSMLIGNDFLPALSYLKIRSHSIEHIIRTFANVLTFHNQRAELIYEEDGRWNINWNLFLPVLSSLSSSEETEYRKMHNDYFTRTRSFNSREEEMNHYGMVNKPKVDTINPNEDGWRNRYYKTLFPRVKIEQVCENYVQGLLWNIDYYLNKTASTTWFYKYDYAPTLYDLTTYMTINSDLDAKRPPSESKYLSSNEHLISILPIQSHGMLSENDKKITCDTQNLRYFPAKYYIQTYLKTYLHECFPMIPAMTMF